MDFTPTEGQAAAQELAARIFQDLSTPERLTQAGRGTDRELWSALCAAGLPAAVDELGLLGLVLLLEEQGRTTAQVPFAASCVFGVWALSRHGTPEQRARLLPALTSGAEVVAGSFPLRPVEAVPDVDGWRLTGVLPAVPWLRDATRVLVPARLTRPHAERGSPDPGRSRAGCFLVRVEAGAPDGGGVRTEAVELTAPWSAGRLRLDGARGELLGDRAQFGEETASAVDDAGAVGAGRAGPPPAGVPVGPVEPVGHVYRDVLAAARIAFAGLQAGVCAGSLARAVEHTSLRKQFGKPLAARQAVLLRSADAHMDIESIRVTTYEAAWRRDCSGQGVPYEKSALTAAWWASEAGKRVVHTGQHLHGGAGADLEHPVHRHFLWGRQLDAYLGSGAQLLAELGEAVEQETAA